MFWREDEKDRATAALWERFPGVERGPAGRGMFALTFDDGPDEDATPAVLDALDAAEARATFFMMGEQVERHVQLAAEVGRRGHLVACHGHSHERHPDRPDEDVKLDLALAAVALREAAGATATQFRPPYGCFSDASYAGCEQRGWERVLWSAWGLDWEERSGDQIVATVLECLDDGGIVLLHDSPRYAERPSAAPTADAIEPLVEAARAKSLAPVTLSELLATDQ